MNKVKARVYVTLKTSVLDPQGKYFEISDGEGEDLDAIAREVLSNPVIEDYRIETLA